MKRVLTAALVLLLALQGIAFSEGDALDVEIGAMYFSDSWNDVTSDTHTFLVVDASLVNWSTQEQILAEEIAAEISYKGSYVFPASLCFSHESIGQLVQLDGQFVFELPNMLAEVAPEELTLKIRVSGKETVVPLSVQSYVPSGNTGSYEGAGYATPEEAVQAYITARQAGDVSAMLSTFAIETYVDSYDAEAFSCPNTRFSSHCLCMCARNRRVFPRSFDFAARGGIVQCPLPAISAVSVALRELRRICRCYSALDRGGRNLRIHKRALGSGKGCPADGS